MEQQQDLPLTRKSQRATWAPIDYLSRYPRLCAHIICLSLGYATPLAAARILQNADRGEPNYCEWIDACYGNQPLPAVQEAIRRRAEHSGYMQSYCYAKRLCLKERDQPGQVKLASWF